MIESWIGATFGFSSKNQRKYHVCRRFYGPLVIYVKWDKTRYEYCVLANVTPFFSAISLGRGMEVCVCGGRGGRGRGWELPYIEWWGRTAEPIEMCPLVQIGLTSNTWTGLPSSSPTWVTNAGEGAICVSTIGVGVAIVSAITAFIHIWEIGIYKFEWVGLLWRLRTQDHPNTISSIVLTNWLSFHSVTIKWVVIIT